MAMSDAVSSGLWVNKSSRARALSLVCGGSSGGCWSSAASGTVSVEGGDGWVAGVRVAMVLLSVVNGTVAPKSTLRVGEVVALMSSGWL